MFRYALPFLFALATIPRHAVAAELGSCSAPEYEAMKIADSGSFDPSQVKGAYVLVMGKGKGAESRWGHAALMLSTTDKLPTPENILADQGKNFHVFDPGAKYDTNDSLLTYFIRGIGVFPYPLRVTHAQLKDYAKLYLDKDRDVRPMRLKISSDKPKLLELAQRMKKNLDSGGVTDRNFYYAWFNCAAWSSRETKKASGARYHSPYGSIPIKLPGVLDDNKLIDWTTLIQPGALSVPAR